jgi:hypothetical protein
MALGFKRLLFAVRARNKTATFVMGGTCYEECKIINFLVWSKEISLAVTAAVES